MTWQHTRAGESWDPMRLARRTRPPRRNRPHYSRIERERREEGHPPRVLCQSQCCSHSRSAPSASRRGWAIPWETLRRDMSSVSERSLKHTYLCVECAFTCLAVEVIVRDDVLAVVRVVGGGSGGATAYLGQIRHTSPVVDRRSLMTASSIAALTASRSVFALALAQLDLLGLRVRECRLAVRNGDGDDCDAFAGPPAHRIGAADGRHRNVDERGKSARRRDRWRHH